MERTLFFATNGPATDRQIADLFTKVAELQKRYKDGIISPQYTLDGLQKLIEGDYPFETKQGIFKRFGPSVSILDNSTRCGYKSDHFFKETGELLAERFSAPLVERLISLFNVEPGSRSDDVSVAPYKFPKTATLSKIYEAIQELSMDPRLTLGHIQHVLVLYASWIYRNKALFEGSSGNYFYITDNTGNPWLIWIWLHTDGGWSYKFINISERPDSTLYEGAWMWLLSR